MLATAVAHFKPNLHLCSSLEVLLLQHVSPEMNIFSSHSVKCTHSCAERMSHMQLLVVVG
eukprot:COSAG02_NODE_538_length_20609_cov_7.009703_22_plen_60_part_00